MSRRYDHCPVCGAHLTEKDIDDRTRLVCDACGFVFYQNPAPAAGVVLVENGELLWVQRKFEPRKGMWTLPAGFLEYDEHVEECAVRETKEETGLDIKILRVFGVYMAMDDPRTQVVVILYLGSRIGGELQSGDDAVDARFFPLDSPPDKIAFTAHEQALADIRKLFD